MAPAPVVCHQHVFLCARGWQHVWNCKRTQLWRALLHVGALAGTSWPGQITRAEGHYVESPRRKPNSLYRRRIPQCHQAGERGSRLALGRHSLHRSGKSPRESGRDWEAGRHLSRLSKDFHMVALYQVFERGRPLHAYQMLSTISNPCRGGNRAGHHYHT